MARIGESADLFKCSFCGKSQKQVQQLIAGPGVYICDECVELCNEIIEERMAETSEGAVADFDLPKPRDRLGDAFRDYERKLVSLVRKPSTKPSDKAALAV